MATDRAPVTLALRPNILAHLEELARVLGTTPNRIVESLVEREWSARTLVVTAEPPWQITDGAIEMAVPLLGARFDREMVLDALEAACIDADAAEREGRRKPSQRRDGRLQYRGPKPHRLTLVVESDASGRKSLVGVSRSG